VSVMTSSYRSQNENVEEGDGFVVRRRVDNFS
jgi:hypothetical protein